jgi:putative PIN family toxin of toxin-antitoxin system
MIHAVLDTNVLVQAVISSGASARVLDAYYDGRFRLIFSPATVEELTDVLLHPVIRSRHGMADDEVVEFVASLLLGADEYPETPSELTGIPRDLSDTRFVALAQQSSAEYLVTNDRRHLLPLGRCGRTRIVTPAQFLRELPRSEARGAPQ